MTATLKLGCWICTGALSYQPTPSSDLFATPFCNNNNHCDQFRNSFFVHVCYQCACCCCGIPRLITLGRSPGICNCTLTNALHRVIGTCVIGFNFFLYYPAIWAATHQFQKIYLHFWRVEGVIQGAYHGWRQSPHNCGVHDTFLCSLVALASVSVS